MGKEVLGVKFRDKGLRAADVFFYMRPQPHCAGLDACLQYMPYENGAYEWDEYPEYRSKAPLDSTGWHHIKLIVSGRRMNAYINGATTPTLAIGRIEGGALEDAISLHGPALYANVKVQPGETGGLSPRPKPDPAKADPRYVRLRRTAGPINLASKEDPSIKGPTGLDPRYRTMPPSEPLEPRRMRRTGASST